MRKTLTGRARWRCALAGCTTEHRERERGPLPAGGEGELRRHLRVEPATRAGGGDDEEQRQTCTLHRRQARGEAALRARGRRTTTSRTPTRLVARRQAELPDELQDRLRPGDRGLPTRPLSRRAAAAAVLAVAALAAWRSRSRVARTWATAAAAWRARGRADRESAALPVPAPTRPAVRRRVRPRGARRAAHLPLRRSTTCRRRLPVRGLRGGRPGDPRAGGRCARPRRARREFDAATRPACRRVARARRVRRPPSRAG